MANTPLASLKFPGLPDTYTIPKNDELVNESVKTALLQLAQKVAYIDEHGQDYYDDLYNALYPAVGVNNIIAVFNSGGVTIYDTNTLDDLRQYLTVTAIMTDSSTEVVTTYTLSGSMDAGTQTITVSYGGKTTTFTVTVVEWLTSITAVFTQGSATIYDTDSLDTLKQYLTVTATYSDTTTATVTDYTLSGTLTAGTSTITVEYGGKTDSFSVTVTFWQPVFSIEEGSPVGANNSISYNGSDTRRCVVDPMGFKLPAGTYVYSLGTYNGATTYYFGAQIWRIAQSPGIESGDYDVSFGTSKTCWEGTDGKRIWNDLSNAWHNNSITVTYTEDVFTYCNFKKGSDGTSSFSSTDINNLKAQFSITRQSQ